MTNEKPIINLSYFGAYNDTHDYSDNTSRAIIEAIELSDGDDFEKKWEDGVEINHEFVENVLQNLDIDTIESDLPELELGEKYEETLHWGCGSFELIIEKTGDRTFNADFDGVKYDCIL